jgi:chemotaxis family two-component system response regulator Rcp1
MFRILIVEDNPADAQIFRMALERADVPMEIVHLEDGVKAMEYLTGGNRGRCDLVLLDLNLPRLNGFEVLDSIRSSQELRSLPVVVLSGSADFEDIERCYRAGANSYVCKPEHLVDIMAVAVQIVTYWAQCVKLPSGSRAGNSVPSSAGK